MSLLRINYCMTCAEGLHFSAFHYTSKLKFNKAIITKPGDKNHMQAKLICALSGPHVLHVSCVHVHSL